LSGAGQAAGQPAALAGCFSRHLILLELLNSFRLAQERLAQMEIEARGWFYEQVSHHSTPTCSIIC
jgi:hypothetical protein